MHCKSLIVPWIAFLSVLSLNTSSAEPIFPPEYNLADEKLLLGIALDDMERVEVAFDEGAELEAEFERRGKATKVTPLQMAVLLGRGKIVTDLLERGADVGDPGKGFEGPPIILAARHNRSKIMGLLIPHFRQLPKGQTKMIRSAFELALREGHLESARVLDRAGFDPTTGMFEGDKESGIKKKPFKLQEAAEYGHPTVVKYLVEERGFDVDQGKESNWAGSPLFSAAMWGNVEVLRYLISQGADMNAPAAGRYVHSGYSPLAIALRYGRVDCARVLLEAGAEPRAKDPEYSPILQADLAGYKEFVERFEAMGLKSPLWELWQEASEEAGEETQEVVEPVATRTGLAAQLLEGEWPSPASEASAAAAERPVRVGILSGSESGALADLLMAELSGLSCLELVERNEMDRIFAEHKLNRAGLLEGEELSDLARLVAADALVMVSREEVDGDQLLRFRWVDARRGLLLGIRYAPEKKSTWPEFAKRYRDYLDEAVKGFRDGQSKKIPVSLTGTHANWATPEAAHLEREAALALQFALSKQTPFMLMERESLQRLVRENRIAGEATHGFQGSGIFLKARVDVDVTTGDLQQIVLQATAPDGSEIATLKKAASTYSLPAACMDIATELTAQMNGEVNGQNPEVTQPDIASDSKEMADEAYWLYRVGLHQQALAVMENAMALGADRFGDWKLYLGILDKEAERLRESDSLADAKFRRLLQTEFERIRSLEYYFEKLDQSDDSRFAKKINFGPEDAIEGFSFSLRCMGSVTLQRRYAAEQRDLQDRFVRLFDEVIRPIVTEEASEGSKYASSFDIQDLKNACLWLGPSLGFQEPEAIESLLAASLSGDGRAYWRYMVAPPPRLGGFPALDRWIRQHASISKMSSYYAKRVKSHAAFFDPLASSYAADPLSKTNGRGVIHMRHWNAEKLRQERDAFLQDHPSAEAHLLRLDRLRKPAPLYQSWTVADQILGCRSIEAQRADAERFQYLASHQDPDFYKRTLPSSLQTAPGRAGFFEKMTDPESMRMKLAAGRALLARLQNQPEADPKFISKYESFMSGLAGRLEVLEEGRKSAALEVQTVPAARWHHLQFLPHAARDGFSSHNFYRVNFRELLRYHDNAWWLFALVKTSGYRICAFRIDDHTLKTEVKTFRTPHDGRLNHGEVEFIVLSDTKIIIGTNRKNGTLVLDWKSGETVIVPGFEAYSYLGGGYDGEAFVHKGKVYYTALPDNGRGLSNSMVFLELDPVKLQQKVLFNFRRNPPETPLDKPIVSKYSNKGFKLRFSKSEGLFGFIHSGERYAFDPATSEFTEISRAAFRKINQTAQRNVRTWPTHDGKSDWYRLMKDGYEDLELGDAVPLALGDRKNDDAVAVVGLEFQNAPGVKVPPSEPFKAAIRARKRNLRLYGYSKKHAVLVPSRHGIVFIKYEDLERAIDKNSDL